MTEPLSHESSGAVGRTCAGCGGVLTITSKFDHRRKWCSEKCRKGSYGDPCIDCGARTVYGAEAARVPAPRCDGCNRRRRADRRCELAVAMLKMRRDGLENPEIAEQLGAAVQTVAQELSRLRALGFDVPYGKYAAVRRVRTVLPKGDHETTVLGQELAERGILPERNEVAA